MLFSLLTLTSAVGFAAAGVIPATHAVHERRAQHARASDWVKGKAVHAQALVPVRIGLAQSNLDKAHDWLMSVSSPDSADYAKFWTSDDVIKAFAPKDETVKAVRDWVVSTGVENARITHTDNQAWLAFDATAEEAEKMLHTKYHYYEHVATGASYMACDEYHIPATLKAHIDYITPGVKGVQVSEKKHKKHHKRKPKQHAVAHKTDDVNSLDTCDDAITPACVRALYNFEELPANAKVCHDNHLGIFEEGDFYAQGDLDLFYANYTLGQYRIPNGTHPTLKSVDGGEAPVPESEAGGESNLDFQLAYPIVYPQVIELFQTDDLYYSGSQSGNASNATQVWDAPGSGFFNTFFDAIDGSYCTRCAYGECGNDPSDPIYPDPNPGGYKGKLMCGVYKPTNVLSVSYGEQERDAPVYYQQRQCTEFLKLGLQGTSIFFASGDNGVSGPPGDGGANGCLGPDDNIFSPADPNSCPYLTNVGATQVFPGKTVTDPESAAYDPPEDGYPLFASGGGFSNIYPIPSYQQNAVASYFKNHDPQYPYYTSGKYTNGTFTPNVFGRYNRNGRGYPDVAANGNNIALYLGGNWTLEGGTSASTPIFASIVNRIVEERLKVGKKPVGFVNPVLYSHPEVLNDITNGTNPGCGTEGFSAVPGWDPVSGLGTPNYAKMLKLWLSLP